MSDSDKTLSTTSTLSDLYEEDDLDLPVDMKNKHPLDNTWTLWFFEPDRSKAWEENLKEIATFNTVEDFWCLFHQIQLPSELRQGCDYALFKHGIKPMWEDVTNARGGRWLINIDKRYRKTNLDKSWLDSLFFMIANESAYAGDICGTVVNIRNRGDKISLWTTDANRSRAVEELGRQFKDRLNFSKSRVIEYQAHKDTMAKGSAGGSIWSKYRV